MKAKSIKGKSTDEIRKALIESMADGFAPTVAIVFVSLTQDRNAICEVLGNSGIAVFGATSNGCFIDADIDMFGISILLMEADRKHFVIEFAEFPEKNYREVAQSVARKAMERIPNPAILIAGSHNATDAELLLFGFADVIGEDVNIHGCMAGDDLTFTNQFVFTNGKESSQGIVALVFDGDHISIKGRATCGWKAVGTVRTVTKSEGNHVYTVDDIPVLDLTAKYGGLENLSEENGNFSIEVASQFPLQLQREVGDPVMRPGLQIDWSDHSFYCSGSVPQGSKVRFSLPPDFDVVEKVIEGCNELKENEIPEADAVIMFSCAGRYITLGPLANQEIEGVQEVWNAPLVGMFSNAELARANGGNLEMHNCTTCCVAIKGK